MTTTTETVPAARPQEAERTINEDMAALAQIIRARGIGTHYLKNPRTGNVCVVGAIAILRGWDWDDDDDGDDLYRMANSDPVAEAIKTKLGVGPKFPIYLWNDDHPEEVLPVIEELAGIGHE